MFHSTSGKSYNEQRKQVAVKYSISAIRTRLTTKYTTNVSFQLGHVAILVQV